MADIDHRIADLAEAYLAGQLSWNSFMESAPRPTEAMCGAADELLYEIEHEPKVGGLFGISTGQAQQRLNKLRELIQACRLA